MIKLIIFDLDGVLIDSTDWHRKALNLALKQCSNYEISDNDHIKRFNGLPTKTKLDMLLKDNIISSNDIPYIITLKQYYTNIFIESFTKPDHKLKNLLNTIILRNCKIACCTNTIRSSVNSILQKLEIYPYFDKIISNEDVKSPKPDPEGYKILMNRFNCKPKETLIIEDSLQGITAAKSSQAHLLIVSSPSDLTKDLIMDKINEYSNTNGR